MNKIIIFLSSLLISFTIFGVKHKIAIDARDYLANEIDLTRPIAQKTKTILEADTTGFMEAGGGIGTGSGLPKGGKAFWKQGRFERQAKLTLPGAGTKALVIITGLESGSRVLANRGTETFGHEDSKLLTGNLTLQPKRFRDQLVGRITLG